MTPAIILAGEAGARLTELTALFGRAYRVIAWSPGEPVPEAAAALDCHVVDRFTKAAALSALDLALPPGTPILTCCHADSVARSASAARHPERFTGFGLLPPLQGRAAVECCRGPHTGDAAAAAAQTVWRDLGMECVWVGDAAGLVMPRIVACLANEAAFAVMERTAAAEDVDRAMELGTGYPRGPLAWAQLLGLDHTIAILDGLSAEQGDDRYRAAPLLRRMALAGSSDWAAAR